MSWFKNLFAARRSEPRDGRAQSGMGQIELLESRLCLGSMPPAPISQPAASPIRAVADVRPSARRAELPVDQASGAPQSDVDAASPTPTNSESTLQTASARVNAAPSILGSLLSQNLLSSPLDGTPESSEVAPSEAVQTGRVRAAGRSTVVAPDEPTSAALAVNTENATPLREMIVPDAADEIADLARKIPVTQIPWFDAEAGPVVIKYDFRDLAGTANEMTAEQQQIVEAALQAWTEATNGRIQWVRDTEVADDEVVVIGTGDMTPLGYSSREGGTLAVGGGRRFREGGETKVIGALWLDRAENWDTQIANGNPAGTADVFTVIAHEAGHVLGLDDSTQSGRVNMMNGVYDGERGIEQIKGALANVVFLPLSDNGGGSTGFSLHAIVDPADLLQAAEVNQLLDRASAASDTDDAIIAIVDRNGEILGVRVEQGVLDTILDLNTLVFAIDGAVAKARTAAMFANGDPDNIDSHSPQGTLAPLTSRTIRFISQSTVTEREVNSNPNIPDPDSTERGPGFVAPIGLGAHFPPEIRHTPPVDLFAIEHTNRDSLLHPGADGIKGTGDDIVLTNRFNADFDPGQGLPAPESYGVESGLFLEAQSRGIATLPGGIPLFRDTNGDQIGDTVVGGIGVFFPGPDGFASFEQGFIPGIGQTEKERTNSDRTLEAEYIAFAAAGGSLLAQIKGAPGAKIGAINGIPPVDGFDLPFGNITLVGIELPVFGPTAGIRGVNQLIRFRNENLTEGAVSGSTQPLIGSVVGDARDATDVPEGWLVSPKDSLVDDLTAADVEQIILQGIAAAEQVRAAIRLDLTGGVSPGARTRMMLAVTDTSGEVLGLFRMKDATTFSIDVSVAKARNVAYYADPAALQAVDQIPGVAAGTAFTNRTFRFVAEPRFPDGVDRTPPAPFSILNDPGIDPTTGENLGAPAPASAFDSVLGHDAFNPMSNFRDPDNVENQNGIVFFPGSTAIYKNGVLIGGFGISGDGVDQDDVVTYLGAQGFLPDGQTTQRADQVKVRGVRLPYIKFNRNPMS
jgi:uncharacterized protein GlcG (DUF336 family)